MGGLILLIVSNLGPVVVQTLRKVNISFKFDSEKMKNFNVYKALL